MFNFREHFFTIDKIKRRRQNVANVKDFSCKQLLIREKLSQITLGKLLIFPIANLGIHEVSFWSSSNQNQFDSDTREIYSAYKQKTSCIET